MQSDRSGSISEYLFIWGYGCVLQLRPSKHLGYTNKHFFRCVNFIVTFISSHPHFAGENVNFPTGEYANVIRYSSLVYKICRNFEENEKILFTTCQFLITKKQQTLEDANSNSSLVVLDKLIKPSTNQRPLTHEQINKLIHYFLRRIL